MKKKMEQLSFSDLDEGTPYMIKNFIVFNSENKPIDISLEHPFSFEGIVFALCTEGYGKVKINFKEHLFEKNSLMTIIPNQMVERMEQSEDFQIELLAFSFDFISDLAVPKDFEMPRRVSAKPVLKITPEELQNIKRYHSFIIETFNNKRHPFFEHVIKGQLYSLLMEIMALYMEQDIVKEKASSRSEEIVEQFLLLLRDHYKKERTASFYADKMFITPKYLSTTLKKITGRSINTWLEDAITMGAKVYLKSTNLTVMQISEELNFPNPSYFGRFFKKNTGMTPKEYRDN
ncbi:MAG: AraC family transcriptional regulator [Dysgonomonas sp.]|nr:AraC family transcriptional regulator [Dysgonomonas sp.]